MKGEQMERTGRRKKRILTTNDFFHDPKRKEGRNQPMKIIIDIMVPDAWKDLGKPK